ncbi:MAG: ATP-binding protein [Christensenellales bacterium]
MNNQMELSFLAVAQNEAFARMVISAFLVQSNPTLSVVSEVRTAVSEAVTNAIVHATPKKRKGDSACVDRQDAIRIEVEDMGRASRISNRPCSPLYHPAGSGEDGHGLGPDAVLYGQRPRSPPGNGTLVLCRNGCMKTMNDDFGMLYEGKAASASRSKRDRTLSAFSAGYVPRCARWPSAFCFLSVQDLCQAGYIGLMLALEHYNAEQGAEFITYAMPWALGEMKKRFDRQTISPAHSVSVGRFQESCAV